MVDMDDALLYRALYRIRRFEETVLENFPRGIFYGTTHTCLGQEANAVGVIACLRPRDIIFSSHRGHGHFLAYGGDPRALFAELMGRSTGVCGGRGGSQHLHWKDFYSNGIQGGIVPDATGMALAEKYKASGAVAVVFLGDGTLGEGVVYESINLAALWGIPILYVVEANDIAQTTPTVQAISGSLPARFEAFGVAATELDSSDVCIIAQTANELLGRIRTQNAPQALILHTCRFGPHSKGDDTRPAELVDGLRRTRDPIMLQAARLTEGERKQIETEIDQEIQLAFQQAQQDPYANSPRIA